MTWLLAVDPGKAACGVALFDDGQLTEAAWVRYPALDRQDTLDSYRLMALTVSRWVCERALPHRLVVERPQAYYGGKSKAPVDDLIPLCYIGGCIAGQLAGASVELVRPDEWKGQIPKAKPGQPYEVERRVRARLTADEAMRIAPTPKSVLHNVIDAIGIGFHFTGRSLVDNRRRVIAR